MHGILKIQPFYQVPKHKGHLQILFIASTILGQETLWNDKRHAVVNRITQKPDKCPCTFPIRLLKNMINMVAL